MLFESSFGLDKLAEVAKKVEDPEKAALQESVRMSDNGHGVPIDDKGYHWSSQRLTYGSYDEGNM